MGKNRCGLQNVILSLLLGSILSACSISASIDAVSKGIVNQQKVTVSLDVPSLTLSEGSSALINVTLSDRRDVDTVVDISLSSVRNDVGDDFMPVVSSVTIPAHSLSAPLLLTSKQDLVYETDEDFNLFLYTSETEVAIERAQTTITVLDDDAMPVANLGTSSQNVNEGVGTGSVNVTLDHPSAFSITIPYTVANGSASGADYTMTGTEVTFLPGETSKALNFTITDDAITETPETFTVQLTAGSSAVTLGSTTLHTVTIVDNEATNLTIDDVNVNEGGNLVFTVSFSVASASTVTFDWATSAGTGVAGVNYTTSSGSESIPAGTVTKTLTVPTLATAAICGADKTVNVTLSNAVNATIADATGIGTIKDPDVPTLSVLGATGSEAGAVTLTAKLSAACATKDVTFNWSNSPGTANPGVDYAVVTGQAVTIAAGATTASLTTTPVNDTLHEANETFTVTLSSLVNAAAGTLSATGTIIDDDENTPFMLKEFNSIATDVKKAAMTDGRVLFSNTDETNGNELWVTDGTAAGSHMVMDINPGTADGAPNGIFVNTTTNVGVFFATTPANRMQAWRSDGTASGTYMLTSSFGTAGAGNGYVLGQMGALTFFVIYDSDWVTEVWATDGTVAGTTSLLNPGLGANDFSTDGVVYGGKFYFGLTTDPDGTGLWRSDGTAAGTVLVKQVGPGESYNSPPFEFTLFNGKIIFQAQTDNEGEEPWVSDGTTAGTMILKDLTGDFMHSMPGDFTDLGGGKMVFHANDMSGTAKVFYTNGTPAGTGGFTASGATIGTVLGALPGKAVFWPGLSDSEPWVTDGTQAGTFRLKDIYAGSTGSGSAGEHAVINGLVLFTADNGTAGTELWATDGTTAGTVLVKDINAGSSPSTPKDFTVVGNKAVFSAISAAGRELWITDGTTAGTVMMADINPGSAGSNPNNFQVIDATHFFFTAYNPTTSTATVYTGDTVAGTVTAVDAARVVTYGANTHGVIALGSSVIFDAVNNGPGNTLWKTDGTTAGTTKLLDIYPTLECTDIANYAVAGGSVFFTATNSANGNEIWRSDGTTAGTTLLKDVYAGTTSASPTSLTPIAGGKMLFIGTTSAAGTEPWVTDGTTAGTTLLKDTVSGTASGLAIYSKFYYNSSQGIAYFVSTNGGTKTAWATDGTTAGTVALTTIGTASDIQIIPAAGKTYIGKSSDLQNYTLWVTNGTNAGSTLITSGVTMDVQGNPQTSYGVLGGNLVFAGTAAASGRELWFTDGTLAGTHLVKDFVAGSGSPASASFQAMVSLGNSVIFQVDNDLWITDGTLAGTTLVVAGKKFNSFPYPVAAQVNGHLLVTLVDAVSSAGPEIWTIDGTLAGSHLLKDFRTGTDLSISAFAILNSKAYFVESDGVHGSELWVTDGNSEGTHMVSDILTGLRSSSPTQLQVANGKLYFMATTLMSGSELWVLDP